MAEVLNNRNERANIFDDGNRLSWSSDSSDEDEPLVNLLPLHLPGTFFFVRLFCIFFSNLRKKQIEMWW